MQCPHCAHPDSIRYDTSGGVQRYRCKACWRIFQTLRRGKDLALKQQARQLYLEGMGMRAKGPLGADQALADDGLWHGHAEGLREFHSTSQALRGKDLHHTNRITPLPTQAFSSQAPS